jgi:hypothetical protein
MSRGLLIRDEFEMDDFRRWWCIGADFKEAYRYG